MHAEKKFSGRGKRERERIVVFTWLNHTAYMYETVREEMNNIIYQIIELWNRNRERDGKRDVPELASSLGSVSLLTLTEI